MRSTLAENLGHMNMISGYARVYGDSEFDLYDFKPLRSSMTYFDLAYGKKWRVNLLLGYQKNLGLANGYDLYTDDDNSMFVKKGVKNVDAIGRIAPSISFNTKAFNIGIEYELTAVDYGKVTENATIAHDASLHTVVNHRVCMLVKYNF